MLTRVLSCCTRGLGCNAHPAFPAPSAFRWARFVHNSGARCAAGRRTRVLEIHNGVIASWDRWIRHRPALDESLRLDVGSMTPFLSDFLPRWCVARMHAGRHSGTRRLNSGLPEFSNMDGPSRQQPTWIARARNPFGHLPGGEMDSGLDAGASPRNDDGENGSAPRRLRQD